MSQVDELLDHLRRDPGGEAPSLEQIRARARRRRRRRTVTAVAGVLTVLTLGAAALGSPGLPRVELAPAGGGMLEVHEAPEDEPADPALPERRVGSWRSLPVSEVVAREQTVSTWTGREVLVWGGARVTWPQDLTAGSFRAEDWELLADGAAFDPASDTWRPMPAAPLSARVRPSAAWTGQELLVWGGADEQGAANDGAAYDPAARRA